MMEEQHGLLPGTVLQGETQDNGDSKFALLNFSPHGGRSSQGVI